MASKRKNISKNTTKLVSQEGVIEKNESDKQIEDKKFDNSSITTIEHTILHRKDDFIRIKGATQHNLNIEYLEIPRNNLVVISGLSGSGKSSLAFDTIFAEGQRRYMESLSSYARQFLGQMQKPKVESIEGLSPAIAIEQKTAGKNPRSTVATVSEIFDYLRLLYARIGIIHCYQCGKEIKKQSISDIIDKVYEFKESLPGHKLLLLSPVISGRKGEYKALFKELKKEGFARIRVDEEIYDLDEIPNLEKNIKHTIEIVIDRLKTDSLEKKRLNDSVELGLNKSDGLLIVSTQKDEEKYKDHLFSLNFACIDDNVQFEELEPKMFSFNNPYGACPDCNGLGDRLEVTPELCLNMNQTLREGALLQRPLTEGSWRFSFWSTFVEHFGQDIDTPLKKYPKHVIDAMLYGTNDKISVKHERESQKSNSSWEGEWTPEGVVNSIKRRWLETTSEEMRSYYEKFMREVRCETCNGNRLNPKYQTVLIGGKGITDVVELSVGDCLSFFKALQLNSQEVKIATDILKEVKSRLGFLQNVGLSYLSLNRKANTLSGGESQRIRLATQVGSALVGVLYVLDEPTIGLHERDKEQLVDTLKSLRDIGNTVLVVEHDSHTMEAANYIIDLGPAAGKHGGLVVAAGTLEEIKRNKNSITGKFLAGELRVKKKTKNLLPRDEYLVIKGAKQHNLKNITVKIPLGLFVVVTGVSGSGKSTLINHILYKVLAKEFYNASDPPGAHDSVEGLQLLNRVILVDQSPIGRTPRSNPATYTKVFDYIRDLFAETKEAKIRGYLKGRFSFNVKGGRCEHCNGDGEVKIEMFFLPDVYIPCEKCRGERYNRETLEVKYKGKNIAEVLDLTVEEAHEFFENIPMIEKILSTLIEVGLSYIKLGQPATTLSGGEAQRVKLAKELSRGRGINSKDGTLYLLDEPTTGLHAADIQHLMNVLFKLRDQGSSIILIEHNLDVISLADWIIDLGPEGGDKGGKIVIEGPPEVVANTKNSYTGFYLSQI
jgi:excinuclease ABC subunit A